MRNTGVAPFSRIGGCMGVFFLFPRRVTLRIAGLEEAKNVARKVLRLVQAAVVGSGVHKVRQHFS